MTIIGHRYTNAVLYHSETAMGLRAAAVSAVAEEADLSGAYLRGADLRGADLSGAYLSGADLRGADLRGADLRGADLRGADLRGADLSGAYLRGADLSGAYLRGADLRGAYLSGAYLSGAYLRGADLTDGLSILQVAGTRDWIVALASPDGVEVRIGCQHHAMGHWLEHYSAIGRSAGYTGAEIEAYRMHLDYVQRWAEFVQRRLS